MRKRFPEGTKCENHYLERCVQFLSPVLDRAGPVAQVTLGVASGDSVQECK